MYIIAINSEQINMLNVQITLNKKPNFQSQIHQVLSTQDMSIIQQKKIHPLMQQYFIYIRKTNVHRP